MSDPQNPETHEGDDLLDEASGGAVIFSESPFDDTAIQAGGH